MNLEQIGIHVHEIVVDGKLPPNTIEGNTAIKIASTIKGSIGRHTYLNDKLFISRPGGVLIIPNDLSYRRFINNTWYED